MRRKHLGSKPRTTARVSACCCDCVGVEKEGRCGVGWWEGGGCSWNSTVATSAFLGHRCPSVPGLEPTYHSFCRGSLREIKRSNQLSHPVLERHMFNLRLEAPYLCGVYCPVVFFSTFIRRLLLDLDSYGENDPDGIFFTFYKQVARELSPN